MVRVDLWCIEMVICEVIRNKLLTGGGKKEILEFPVSWTKHAIKTVWMEAGDFKIDFCCSIEFDVYAGSVVTFYN